MLILKCSRCNRDNFTLPIGLVFLLYPNETTKKINVCVKHIDTIAHWLNLSTNTMIKLPRTTLHDSKQLKISE